MVLNDYHIYILCGTTPKCVVFILDAGVSIHSFSGILFSYRCSYSGLRTTMNYLVVIQSNFSYIIVKG